VIRITRVTRNYIYSIAYNTYMISVLHRIQKGLTCTALRNVQGYTRVYLSNGDNVPTYKHTIKRLLNTTMRTQCMYIRLL
jgi:hypothetical protein